MRCFKCLKRNDSTVEQAGWSLKKTKIRDVEIDVPFCKECAARSATFMQKIRTAILPTKKPIKGTVNK